MEEENGVSVLSPYFPYEKVQTGFPKMAPASEIPGIVCRYLLDLPLPGYTPQDDNGHPRCRLMKRLWYDGDDPLSMPLPTPTEKLSLLFDGGNPVLNTPEEREAHPKGYRLYPVQRWLQSQLTAETSVKVYIGREIPDDDFRTEIAIVFEIYANANLETEMGVGGLSKAYAMEKDIVDALHGVNLAGIGVVNYSRRNHGDAGSQPFYDESGTNVGRRLTMSVSFTGGGGGVVEAY